ncbi:MAG TPA: nitroreductase/quinone reductase family protein [Sporichthyaceae bacterium]|nr:nitroreductase/quinone reductase family protein [Sporichthyaceae bacterium]
MAVSRRQRVVNKVQKYVANPLMRKVPIQILLETTGRKSGEPRRTPIGGRTVDNAFWMVAEFGTNSQYVKNIEADPEVRVRVRGRWHSGTAYLLPDDDARARLRSLPKFNSAAVKTVGTDLLTIRIDLRD